MSKTSHLADISCIYIYGLLYNNPMLQGHGIINTRCLYGEAN